MGFSPMLSTPWPRTLAPLGGCGTQRIQQAGLHPSSPAPCYTSRAKKKKNLETFRRHRQLILNCN